MDTLTSLRVFAAVADLKSFAQAADRLGLSPAMASKHVQHLEHRLRARLLNRTSRNVSLTEAGAVYRDRVRAMLDNLDDVEAQLAQATVTPRGVLRVSLPIWIVNRTLARIVADYQKAFPEVMLDVDFSGQIVNLVEEGFDLAFRSEPNLDKALISRKLAPMAFALFASPDYLDREGRPTSLGDLEGKPFMAYTPVADQGVVRIPEGAGTRIIRFKPVLRSGNEALLLLAASEGMGYCFLPSWIVRDEVTAGRLERVLPREIDIVVPFYAVYPNRGYLPAKTRSFLDFVAERVEREPFL